MVFRMKVENLEPGKLVVWSCQGEHPEWAGTTLTWNISNEGGVTVVRFTHSGWKFRLQGHLEGRNHGPHWTE